MRWPCAPRCHAARQTVAAPFRHFEPRSWGSDFSRRVSQIRDVGGDETVWGMTAILGYARVSTIGQDDLDAQLAALYAAGVEPGRIFTDKPSGSAKTARPGLAAMLDYARASDTVVVTAVDRLGRSVAEVTRTIAELGKRRILLRTSREGIDTATPIGRAVAAIMANFPADGPGRHRDAVQDPG